MKRTICIICLAFLLGIGTFQIYQHNVLSTANFEKNIIKQSCVIPYKSQSDLTRDSDVIIKGTVKEILPSKWSNPGMKKGDSVRNILQTNVVVNIEEIIKGTPYNSEEINVRINKGETDDDIVISDGYPDFINGEEVLLFLSTDNSDVANKNENYYVLTGMIQGKYTITEKNGVINDSESSGKDNDKIVSCAYDPDSKNQESLSDFKKEILNIKYQEHNPVEKMTPEEIEKNNEAVLGK